MITFATEEMIPSLKHIWKECFQDEDSYIDFYFSRRFSAETVLAYCSENKPVSMLSLLPAVIGAENKELKVKYIYAVATLPAYQGNGYGSLLLSHALDLLKSKGEHGILVPADAGLFSFYEKRGFVKRFDIVKYETGITQSTKLVAAEQKKAKLLLSDISAKEYKVVRDACFMQEGYVSWDEASLAYAMEETLMNGGFCKKLTYQRGSYGAIFYIKEEEFKLYVKEITAKGEDAKLLIKELMKQYGLKKAEAYLSVTGDLREERQGFAMGTNGLPFSDYSYFNLTLG